MSKFHDIILLDKIAETRARLAENRARLAVHRAMNLVNKKKFVIKMPNSLKKKQEYNEDELRVIEKNYNEEK